MLNKILAAINNFESKKPVFKQTLDLATATGACLILVHLLSCQLNYDTSFAYPQKSG